MKTATEQASTEQITTEQWHAANNARAALYRWFADVFAHELSQTAVADLPNSYTDLHQIFSDLGLEAQSTRLKKAIHNLQVIPESDRFIELAADFAQIFLLSDKNSAPPYASYYIDADNMLYGKPAQQMGQFLDTHQLSLHPDFREPKDHISVYLNVMSVWIHSSADDEQNIASIAKEQAAFLEDALLNWLPQFSARCQKIRVKTDIYPALTDLLQHFVQEDKAAMLEMINELS